VGSENISNLLGPPTFRRGIHEYLVARANGNARADDFLAALSRVSERDVAIPLKTLIDQSGVPLVRARLGRRHAQVAARAVALPARWLAGGFQRDVADPHLCAARGRRESRDYLYVDDRTDARLELGTPHARTAARSRADAACPAVVFPNADGHGYLTSRRTRRDFHAPGRETVELSARFDTIRTWRTSSETAMGRDRLGPRNGPCVRQAKLALSLGGRP
jgi:hypothetical protein